MSAVAPTLWDLKDGKLHLRFHPGQLKAWDSKARFVLVTAGAQSGKSEFEIQWLVREIGLRGTGDYLAVSATYPLLDKKLLPAMRAMICNIMHLGEYKDSKGMFELADGSRIILGSGTNPEAIESATAKAAILDECGQKDFKREVWEGVQRRLSINQGRALLASTVYNLGWLKTDVADRAAKRDPDYEHIQFDSTTNPAFPVEEFERARRTLPAWKFDMQYRGLFTRPAGLIYDSFNSQSHVVPRFDIPKDWPRYVGHDFGPVHMAALFYALDRDTGDLFAYREYLDGGLSVAGHARKLLELSAGEHIMRRVGGAHTEDGWREAFGNALWPIEEPGTDKVDLGIQRVYGWHKTGRLKVFSDLQMYLDEKTRYSWALDDLYRPVQGQIEDKATFHLMDAERYLLSSLDEPVTKMVRAEYRRPIMMPQLVTRH